MISAYLNRKIESAQTRKKYKILNKVIGENIIEDDIIVEKILIECRIEEDRGIIIDKYDEYYNHIKEIEKNIESFNEQLSRETFYNIAFTTKMENDYKNLCKIKNQIKTFINKSVEDNNDQAHPYYRKIINGLRKEENEWINPFMKCFEDLKDQLKTNTVFIN